MQKVLKKAELNKFIGSLMKQYEVIAPVKTNISKFEKIKDPKEIYLDELTLMPLKRAFMPEAEPLFTFENNRIKTNSQSKKRIIFGMRKCDLNALSVLDKVMHDPHYIEKRKNTILIGFYCEHPDKYCFCNSMDLEDYYDLFFYPEKDKYYISIGSQKGQSLVKGLKDADKEVVKEIKNIKRLKNKDIEKDYHNKLWNKDIEKCLSCGACTVFCPTCNCFNIEDIKDLGKESGKRIRKQTSCQLVTFTEVAGGKAFRDSRSSRFKHFVYHKVIYYKKKYNKYMCVGCGRCLRACPTRIDWVDTINSIKSKGNK